MFYVALIAACLVLLAIFFGVTIAGGRAHDRQNREQALREEQRRTSGDARS